MAVEATEQSAQGPVPGLVEERRLSPGLLLALLGHHAMRRLREAHTRHELSPRQFQLLGLLHESGPLGQRELGQRMEIDPSILVTLLNPLEAEGLLSRRRDPLDRRRHLVTLTARGERRLTAAARAQREAEDELFAGFDEQQREELRVLLTALKDSLSTDCAAGSADCEESRDEC
ncbi:MAG TPA: MarR family winged helix-turn-helix transcriptional regulator [Solirubrobacteraceae bacterium]|nr:MarR family winged helix-turn-helix transcriptional regulator [Solirubrobacteraceae bacterium]